MVRTTYSEKNGLKKGAWTPEEDRKLVAYVSRYGHWNWRLLPKFAGLARCGKSCRLRWLNYLRPNIKRGNYTQEEEETIIKLLQQFGNRWSAIADRLPGRTDNEIKNYWHTNLKKRFQQNSIPHEKAQAFKSKDHSQVQVEPMPSNINGPFKSPPATCPFSSSSSVTTDHSNGNFALQAEFAFLDANQEPMNGSLLLEPYVADISHLHGEILENEAEGYDGELWSHDNKYCA